MRKILSKTLAALLAAGVILGCLIVPSSSIKADGDPSDYIKINKTQTAVICGKSETLKVTSEAGWDTKKTTWKSSNTKIATVDSRGKVTAKQAGSAKITATLGNYSVSCNVQALYKDVVDKSSFWYTPTYELTNKGVVKGYDNQTKFKPANKCTRAQMVTFIWRLMGEPKPKSTTCKFKDVKKTDYFYKACIWGNEKKIVEGYSDGTFGPSIVCARKHAVTFLWRLAGKPEPKNTKSKFTDVKKTDYFYKATIWAAEKEIVAGYEDGTFKPDGNCLRRQMVTFLYKYTKNKNKKSIIFPDNPSGGGNNGGNNGKTGNNVINVYSYTDEVPNLIKAYMDSHPDVAKKYKIKTTVVYTDGGAYQAALDAALTAGGDTAPDIYAVQEDFAYKYTKGDMSAFAAPYTSLGIKSGEITDAKIAPYIQDIGTRTKDSKVVGLAYQSNPGAFIYRRSIAKEVFGTDSPDKIASQIGPGWDKFFSAAAKLKSKGYAIVSGLGDVQYPVNGGATQPWINKNNQFVIDSSREAYFDIAKKLYVNGYTNDTTMWTESWYLDMCDMGPRKCFGFFGPAWMLNYIIAPQAKDTSSGDWAICKPTQDFYWGGTWVLANKDTEKAKVVGDIIRYITLDTSNSGLQYRWARGDINGGQPKDTVASSVVMSNANGKIEFLNNQDMFKVYNPALSRISAKAICQYDSTINSYWIDCVREYAYGDISKTEAIKTFKSYVEDKLGFKAK